jgi:hypothetical protein
MAAQRAAVHGRHFRHRTALRRRARAALAERTTGAEPQQRGRGTADLLQPLPRSRGGRHRVEQAAGVRMAWRFEHIGGRADLDDAPGVHDCDAVGEAGDHREVVGDPDQRRARIARQLLHLVQDLSLHGDVEGGRWLVGNDQFRAVQQRDGDRHALAHPARELVRVLVQPLGRGRDADAGQGVDRTRARGLARGALVREHCFDHLGFDRQDRVQRHHRVLEDHGDPAAAQRAHALGCRAHQFLAVEGDAAPGNAARWIDQPDDRESRDGLARSGFADQSEHFAACQVDRHVGHGGQHAVARREFGAQVAHGQQRGAHRASLGFRTSRSWSPTRLMARIVSSRAMPGYTLIQYLPDIRYS